LRARSPIISCDLTDERVLSQQLEEFKPNVVLHLAAERRHEAFTRHSKKAVRLNVNATSAVAAAAERHGAWFVYVSTDQVFDGTEAL